jgi:ribose 5-phosphate isomerase B
MPSKENIQQIVRRVVLSTLGRSGPTRPAPRKTLVTELDIRPLPFGANFNVPAGAIVTPLARQVAMDRHVRLLEAAPSTPPAASQESVLPQPRGSAPAPASQRIVAIGADHAGFQLKESLKAFLTQQGYSILDCGTSSSDSVDYPDFAMAVAELVSQGRAWRGIMVNGAGIGSCMAANKVPGIRAAMCYDTSTAINSREHNDANLLTLGAGLIGASLAQQIVATWLETAFAGGRHARRIEKIAAIEKRYIR